MLKDEREDVVDDDMEVCGTEEHEEDDETVDEEDDELDRAGALPISIILTLPELSPRSVEHPAKTQNDIANDAAAVNLFLISVFPKICI